MHINLLHPTLMWLTRTALLFSLYLLAQSALLAAVPVAILEFELKDLTLMPGGTKELERTASLKPLLTGFG